MKLQLQRLVAFIFVAGALLTGSYVNAQQAPPAQNAAPTPNFNMDYGNTRWFPSFWEPYATPYVPEAKMSNSDRLHYLLSDGKLRLSIQDTIELALENNLDIALARYTIAYSHTDVLRTQGGGSARGFTGSFQSSALFTGAVGSNVSAGGTGVSSGAGGAAGSNSATQLSGNSFDPSAFFSFGWDRNTTPLGTTVLTGVPSKTLQGAKAILEASTKPSRPERVMKSCSAVPEAQTMR